MSESNVRSWNCLTQMIFADLVLFLYSIYSIGYVKEAFAVSFILQ